MCESLRFVVVFGEALSLMASDHTISDVPLRILLLASSLARPSAMHETRLTETQGTCEPAGTKGSQVRTSVAAVPNIRVPVDVVCWCASVECCN